MVVCLLMQNIFMFKVYNKNVYFPTQYCLVNISQKGDYIDSEEVLFKSNVYDFSVGYNNIDKPVVLNIQKY